MINTFICSRSCLENHPPFQAKIGKMYVPVFRPKRPKDHTLWGCTYYMAYYKGVYASWAIAYIVYLQKFDTSHNFETNHNNCLLLKKKNKNKKFYPVSMLHVPQPCCKHHRYHIFINIICGGFLIIVHHVRPFEPATK